MGHSIPVIYLTCERREAPTDRTSWNSAREVVEKAFQDGLTYNLQRATGRNWWQLHAIAEIRDRDGLDGLRFIDEELAVIEPERLPVTIESLQRVISARQELGQVQSPLRRADEREIDCDSDGGFERFLSSLLAVCESARASGRAVVFVQPQP